LWRFSFWLKCGGSSPSKLKSAPPMHAQYLSFQ
jgi:hypothetical protein